MTDTLKPYIYYSETLSNNRFLHILDVGGYQQKRIARIIKKNKGVLLTEYVSPINQGHDTQWSILYLIPDVGLYCVQSTLNKKHPALVDLSAEFPVCNRLQRAIYELTRIPTKGVRDKRQWLNHGHFAIGIVNEISRLKPPACKQYPFKRVSGEGVHEIPVGPVHAGIIEPGHFRFSVVGERILKLEERFGYTHKGIHQLLKNKSIDDARKLISRISGDSTVAYSIAFVKAYEHQRGLKASQTCLFERGVCLERERLSNHIGDIGSIINDTGLPSLQSSFTCLKELLLRSNELYLGHRYLMDCIVPLPQKALFPNHHLDSMKSELRELGEALVSLKTIIERHFGLQDRLCDTGIISKEQAIILGLLGVAAKASGIDNDARRLIPETKVEQTIITNCDIQSGDVSARVNIRFKECFESIKLIENYIHNLLSNRDNADYKINPSTSKEKPPFGISVVEGWRGPITIVLSLKDDRIEWCHFHDPSWQNWLAVEYAVHNNIVADFPLINKSFNLSYSGHDS